MKTAVQTVSRGTPAANAGEKMRAKGIHHLVVTEQSELVGVLSARDLRRFTRRGGSKQPLVVGDVMTPQVVTVAAGTSVHRAANVMRGRSVGCLVVTDGGRVVGIVTTADLLDQLGQGRHARTSESRPALHFRVPHEKQHRSGASW